MNTDLPPRCSDVEEYDLRTDLPIRNLVGTLCVGREVENSREARMSFRRLKRRYQSGNLSFTPISVHGCVCLRGRGIKATHASLHVVSHWLLAAKYLTAFTHASTGGYPFSNLDRHTKRDREPRCSGNRPLGPIY